MKQPPVSTSREFVVRAIAFCVIVLACWYSMQSVHELGHVLGAEATGGRVTRVVIELFSFSRTDVDPNPRPLVVAWGGPIVGVALPLVLWAAMGWLWRGRSPSWWVVLHRLAGVFSGFCLVANGAYIALGSLDRIGDAGDLLQHGAPGWTLWAFGTIAFVLGLCAWHTLGNATTKPLGATQHELLAACVWLALCFAIVVAV